tara:strand:- start:1012 stop:1368 length:357 start_codon:yes stop_codon:yes gene_type:complete
MPTYNFRNVDTDEVTEEFMGIAARDEYLAANPQLRSVQLTAPMIVGGTGELHSKIDNGMKEVLDGIADANPNSPMRDSWGSDRGVKKTKERELMKKAKAKAEKLGEAVRAKSTKFVQS